MPSLDTLRRRISLTEAHLELLRLTSNGETSAYPDAEAAGLEALSASGLVTADGAVHPLVADLATAMSQPVLELWIETMSERGPTVSHIVVRGDEDVWYTDPWPGAGDDDEVVFVKDELPQLLWIIARLVGFRRSEPPARARPVTAQLGTVASLLAAFSAETGDSWDDVRTVAIARLDDIFGDSNRSVRRRMVQKPLEARYHLIRPNGRHGVSSRTECTDQCKCGECEWLDIHFQILRLFVCCKRRMNVSKSFFSENHAMLRKWPACIISPEKNIICSIIHPQLNVKLNVHIERRITCLA